jgi:hypothetical protein
MSAKKSKRSVQPRKSRNDSETRVTQWDSFELPTGSVQTYALSPSELFEECTANERRISKSNVMHLLDRLARFYLFDRPLFGQGSDWTNDGYPLLFTIRKPKIVKTSKSDWRYAELLRHLKNLDDPELRWILIARWLNVEAVCDPEDFLPASMFRRMLKKTRAAKIRLSSTDVYLWRLVRIWLPYFEYLLADLNRAPRSHRGPKEALVKGGYLEDAVEWSLQKRSAVQAVTSWLEQRNTPKGSKQLSARTLENAYSRVMVAMRKADSDVEKFQHQSSESTPR